MPNPAVRAASARVPLAATDKADRPGAFRHAEAPASLVEERVAAEASVAAEERVAVEASVVDRSFVLREEKPGAGKMPSKRNCTTAANGEIIQLKNLCRVGFTRRKGGIMAVCSICFNVVIDATDIDGNDPLQKIVSEYAWQVKGHMMQRGMELEVCPECLEAALNFSPEARDRADSLIDNNWVGRGSVPMQGRAILSVAPNRRR